MWDNIYNGVTKALPSPKNPLAFSPLGAAIEGMMDAYSFYNKSKTPTGKVMMDGGVEELPAEWYTASADTGTVGNSSYSSGTRSSRPAVSQPRIYTAKELAEMYGINYDYDYILGLLNNASDAKYNESQNEVKKMQLNNARQGAGTFATYLNALRQSKSNAVATGINKGTQAAQELSATLGSQQLLSANQTKLDQEVLKLIDLASTQRANNQVLAFDNYNKLGQYLGTLSTNLNANDVQKYVAELSAAAAASASSGGGSYTAPSNASFLDSLAQNYINGVYKNSDQRQYVENVLGIVKDK